MGSHSSQINLKVMSQNDAEALELYAISKVAEWHDRVKPDYVFLNETSAVPLGYVLKEAWKTAYPDEKSPVFYRINPAVLPTNPRWDDFYGSERGIDQRITRDPKYQKKMRDFFKYRIKKKNPIVVVLDEHSASGRGLDNVRRAIHNSTDIPWEDIHLENAKEFNYYIHDVIKKYTSLTEKEIRAGSRYTDSAYLLNSPENVEFRGKIRKGNKGIKSTGALFAYPSETFRLGDYIHDLKETGRAAGGLIREKELNRQSGLEKKISATISILLLVSSMFFIFPQLTGNVIRADSIKSFHLLPIGAVLFLLGMVIGFFCLKNSKK